MFEFNVTPRPISQNDGNTLKYQGRETSLQRKIPEKVHFIKKHKPSKIMTHDRLMNDYYLFCNSDMLQFII